MANHLVKSFWEAHGTIDYNMTNNYMFRYILQENEKVLRGLICSLLHLSPSQIKSVEITNPINLAGNISGKEFILDIKILLNNNRILNLEMQVRNEHNWPERSLVYLCRSFDQLYRGQDYAEAHPAMHVGFVDFSPEPNEPEFYATYKMTNIKTHRVYSDKFILSVVDLSKIELATEEDKAYGIDRWAKLFKAKTWEELRMYVKDDEYLKETAHSLYRANADDIVREQCLAREDAERRERTLERDIKLLQEKIEQMKAEKEAESEAVKAENAAMKQLIKELQDKLSEKEGVK